jgi:GxxExxY protein
MMCIPPCSLCLCGEIRLLTNPQRGLRRLVLRRVPLCLCVSVVKLAFSLCLYRAFLTRCAAKSEVVFHHRDTEGTEKMTTLRGNALTERVIGFAIDVHRQLGPGLLESTYEECLCFELKQGGIEFARQVPLPVVYKDIRLDCGYRMDLVVQQEVIIEIKAVERLMPIHEAQVLTYLRLGGHKIGLLMSFNSLVLKDGLRRFML